MKPFKANWRIKEEYPPCGCEDHNRLAWEFIRRHPDYAVHAQQMFSLVEAGEYRRIDHNSDSCLDGVECWPKAKPGETAKGYFARLGRRKKNGAINRPRIDRPCNSFMNKWRLEGPVAPDAEYSSEAVKFLKHEVRLKRHTSLKTRNFTLFLYPNEAAVRFRLDIPVAEQIDMARLKLIEATKAYAKAREALADETRALLAEHARSELPAAALGDAHYWLRCYDAELEPKKLTERKKARREQASGPGERRKQFNEERRAVGMSVFDIGKIKGFLKLAHDFINNRKFLLLMTSGPRRRPSTARSK
jgi:hypothetical protein